MRTNTFTPLGSIVANFLLVVLLAISGALFYSLLPEEPWTNQADFTQAVKPEDWPEHFLKTNFVVLDATERSRQHVQP